MNEELLNSIEILIKSIKSTSGLYIKVFGKNLTYESNENNQFWAASVIKIPVMVEFFRKANEENININQKIAIKEENFVRGSGIAHLLNRDNHYSYIDLVKLMIILSDNAATNEIVDFLGWENIEKSMKNLGLENTTFRHKMQIKAGRGPNLTTAKDMGILLEKIYFEQLAYSGLMIEILNEVKNRERIPKLIPNEIKIAHKVGSLPEAVHDVGIVYASNPFIISFLSDDQKDKVITEQIIREITKVVFEFSTLND